MMQSSVCKVLLWHQSLARTRKFCDVSWRLTGTGVRNSTWLASCEFIWIISPRCRFSELSSKPLNMCNNMAVGTGRDFGHNCYKTSVWNFGYKALDFISSVWPPCPHFWKPSCGLTKLYMIKQIGLRRKLSRSICRFSRKVLWLNVAQTNNDPKFVATYYMDYLNDIKGD